MEDCKVIVDRAYFGRKDIQRLKIPFEVTTIGDYAFASCINLKIIELPRKELTLGRKLFYHDKALEKICLYDEKEKEDTNAKKDALWRLLALLVTEVEAEYLLDLMRVGSLEWYEMIDRKLEDFLGESEEEFWKNLVYCAEEDMEEKRVAYLRNRDLCKTRCVLERLCIEEYLSKERKERFLFFLRERVSDPLPEVLCRAEDCGKDYCDVLIKNGMITMKSRAALLEKMGECNLPLKAYILQISPRSDDGSDGENSAFLDGLTI